MTKIIIKIKHLRCWTQHVWHSLLKTIKILLLDYQNSCQSTKNSSLNRCRLTSGYTEEHIDHCFCSGGVLCVCFSASKLEAQQQEQQWKTVSRTAASQEEEEEESCSQDLVSGQTRTEETFPFQPPEQFEPFYYNFFFNSRLACVWECTVLCVCVFGFMTAFMCTNREWVNIWIRYRTSVSFRRWCRLNRIRPLRPPSHGWHLSVHLLHLQPSSLHILPQPLVSFFFVGFLGFVCFSGHEGFPAFLYSE